MAASRKGRLLIAVPMLSDPNFDRTIVFMIEDNDDGSTGLVLNRPSPVPVTQALPDLSAGVTPPSVLFVGGPVNQNTANGLARVEAADRAGAVEGWLQVTGDIGTINVADWMDGMPAGVVDLRVFAGYAGWGPGQLDGEMDAGAWLVVDADPGDPLSSEPEDLWRTVLRRQPGETAWLANYPPDPAVN